MLNFRIFSILFLFCSALLAQPTTKIGEAEALNGVVIARVKEEHRSLCSTRSIESDKLTAAFSLLKTKDIKRKFPNHTKPFTQRNANGQKLSDLSLIYELNYEAEIPVLKACAILNASGLFEYVEPHYLPKLFYTPNDPGATRAIQYYLTNIKAYEGWDISKGDTNVVIGITDTGTDPSHPDLYSSIKRNYMDPIDGIDNDLDGYTDNFLGWDLGENDNNPTYNANAHGVHVSGLSAAVTDNGVGMAGVGFRCKYLPVKIANANGSLTAAFEGIVYAADHGCKVINCSWGGTGAGQYGQDIVDYAVFNRDAVVVAASGNDNKNLNYYPASFKHVLSVSATDSVDVKATFSNFGCLVDVTAPGADIYSTWPGGYLYSGGTSMASPITAGVVGIVRSKFPNYTALQALEQVKVTSDSIYTNNILYTDMLGRGRVNLFRALTQTNSPSVDLESYAFSDNANNIFSSGDSVTLKAIIINYLKASQSLTLTLRTASPYITVLDSTSSIAPMMTFEKDSNSLDPFRFVIKPTTPTNTVVRFKLLVTGGNYGMSFCFDLKINVDYINVRINDISTTITSRGRIGYNSDTQSEGIGFIYDDRANLLTEAGLMLGTSVTKVSDAVTGDTPGVADRDFVSLQNVREVTPSVISEYDLKGVMNDDSAGISKLNVRVTQNTYVWSTPGHRKYIIIKYDIKNPGNIPVINLHAGIYADWDIQDPSKNRAAYDQSNKMGYCYNPASLGFYGGVKLLTSNAQPFCYSIDNTTGGSGGVDVTTGFSTSEKFVTLTSNRYLAGQTGTGGDVIQVVSTGPLVVLPGDSVSVAFAMIGGEDFIDLQESAVNAQEKYEEVFPIGVSELKKDKLNLYPNPVSGSGNVWFVSDQDGPVTITVVDQLGQVVKAPFTLQSKHGELHSITLDRLACGIYNVIMNGENGGRSYKLVIAALDF